LLYYILIIFLFSALRLFMLIIGYDSCSVMTL